MNLYFANMDSILTKLLFWQIALFTNFFLKTGEYQFNNVNSTRSHVDDVINVNMDTNVVEEN